MSLEAISEHLAAIGRKPLTRIGVTFEDEKPEEVQEDPYAIYDDYNTDDQDFTENDDEDREDWVDETLDGDALLCDMFKPGVNHVTDGIRGGGKTFQAIAYTQPIVEGKIKGMTKTILLTNVIFIKRVAKTGIMENDFVMETPPGVHHITSMEEIFRYATKYMLQYGRQKVQFIVILDEVQNFLLAEEYQADLQITFVKWYGTTRKFNVCLWMLTPSINNLPPRARNFLDDEKAGYVSYLWRKNKRAVISYLQEHNIRDVNVQTFTTLSMSHHDPPSVFRVLGTSWTKDVEDVEIGEYCYDHLACADFKLSLHKDEEGNETFNFNQLMELCSDAPSYLMPKIMDNFFKQMDGKATVDFYGKPVNTNKEDTEYERALQIRKMRDMGLKIKQISYILKKPDSTIRSWHDKFFDPKTGQPLKEEYAYDGGLSPIVEKSSDEIKPKGKPRGNAARKSKRKAEKDAGIPEGDTTPSDVQHSLKNDVSSLESSSSSTTLEAGAYISIPRNEEIEGGPGNFSLSDPNAREGGVATVATPQETMEAPSQDDDYYDDNVDLDDFDDEEINDQEEST